jgi:glycosyltransferase involved in cell wall biosynthesis
MRCPKLSELPAPPAGKTGWPWTEESGQLAEVMEDGKVWPKISVVTPSYNQGKYLEETIRSVLLQGYPNLEYVVIDGGSTDESVEVIKKYEKWLSYWVSEKDRGQSHAINKGIEKTSGEIVAYVNSDDFYRSECLSTVARMLNPDAPRLLFGDLDLVEGTDPKVIGVLRKDTVGPLEMLYEGVPLCQPSCFWTKPLLDKIGLFNENLHYTMDYDLMLRIVTAKAEQIYVPMVFAVERRHVEQKTDARNKKAIYYERAHTRLAAASRLGMGKWSFLVRALLHRRVRRPFPWGRWKELTLQEKMLFSAIFSKDRPGSLQW